MKTLKKRLLFTLPLGIFFFWNNSFAQVDIAVSVTGDYAQQAMTELAAVPPLLLLENKEGESRSSVIAGYLELAADEDVTLADSSTAHEDGEAKGFGMGYGYSRSFSDRWAFYGWLQLAFFDGDHRQVQDDVATFTTKEMSGFVANLNLGISYEFFRDSEKHTLNVFGGPALMFYEHFADIKTFNTSGQQTTDFEMELSHIVPAVTVGAMYDYKFFENWKISPYGILVISLADECQSFDTPRVSLNQLSGESLSSPECEAATSFDDATTDIIPTFGSIGVRFEYLPWKTGFSVSSYLRNLILNPDNGDKAEIKGTLLSLSKTW